MREYPLPTPSVDVETDEAISQNQEQRLELERVFYAMAGVDLSTSDKIFTESKRWGFVLRVRFQPKEEGILLNERVTIIWRKAGNPVAIANLTLD